MLLICREQQSYFEVSLFLYINVFIWKVSIPNGNFSDMQVYGSYFIPKVIIPKCHCSERLLFLKVVIPKFEMFERCLERDCLEY